MFQHTDELDYQNLDGWEEVRSALEEVEKIRNTGQDARVEIVNSNADTILRITLRSIDELETYFKSHLRQLILQNTTEDLSVVSGRIVVQ